MLSNEKIKQVFNAIKDNGIEAFDNESLAKLLSILSPEELDEFVQASYQELGQIEACKRIMNIKPLVETLITKELYRIRTSTVYNLYIESLNSGEYREFFKKLKEDELADLKRYISYTSRSTDPINVNATKKIIDIITKEIKMRDDSRKPRLEGTY